MKQLFFQKPFKYSYNKATLILIGINIAIFALRFIAPEISQYIYAYSSLNIIAVNKYHMFWQFFTYMFIHKDMSHIFFNMFGLLMFGLQLEKAIGSKEFVLMYLICGILGGVFSYVVYLLTGQTRVSLMGASGAIYAILFAYAVVYPRSTIFIWGILPLPAPLMVALYAIIEIVSQLFGTSANVAHLTHLFGFVSAWLYFLVRMKINPIKIWKNEYKK